MQLPAESLALCIVCICDMIYNMVVSYHWIPKDHLMGTTLLEVIIPLNGLAFLQCLYNDDTSYVLAANLVNKVAKATAIHPNIIGRWFPYNITI